MTIPPETIARTFIRRVTPQPSIAPPGPSGASKVGGPSAGAPKPAEVVPGGRVKPTVVPRPAANRPPTPTTAPAPVPVYSGSSSPAPAYSTSTGMGGGGVFGDPVLVDPEMIEQVAQSVYDVWAASATDEQLQTLRAGRPNVPQELDRILLIDLVNRSGISDIPTWARHSLRENFWHAVNQL